MPIFKRNPADHIELPSFQQGKVIPVLQARALLGSPGHQSLIDEIRVRVGLSNDEFEVLYQGFLDRFAEFVQLMPVKPTARLGTLLNDGLLRGINCLHYLVENHKDADDVEYYAMFTAAVLYDVATSLIKQRVFITEEGGTHITDWIFSKGNLREQSAKWYKIFPYKASYVRLRDPITVLLAEQIMPPEGYRWITSYWSVFVDWLEVLCQTGEIRGIRFEKILDIIRMHEEEELFLEHLPEIDVDLKEPEDTLVADEFFKWLDREIDEDKLKVAGVDPDLYVFHDGIFLDSRVIDRFSKYYNSPTTIVWFQIGNCLGIAKQSGQDFRFDQFFAPRGKGLLQAGGQQAVNGLYLSNDFAQVKGSANLQVKLQGSAPSRDYQVTLQQFSQLQAKKGR
jgi:hypothetical protein